MIAPSTDCSASRLKGRLSAEENSAGFCIKLTAPFYSVTFTVILALMPGWNFTSAS